MKPKTSLLRLTISRAAIELGLDRKTLAARLADAGENPDAAGLFSLRQVVGAVHGDHAAQKLRGMKAAADMAELERDEKAGKLLPASAVEAVWLDALSGMKDVIMSTPMPDESRRQIMKAMQTIPLAEYSAPQANAGDADAADGTG